MSGVLSLITTTGEFPLQVARTILELVGQVPDSTQRPSRHPLSRARQIGAAAQTRATVAAAAMALPPGPAGALTLIPELFLVWRIQTQMVADIAAVYGHKLTPEQMIYCLFRATAVQAVSALVVIVGERVLIRRPEPRSLESIALKIGTKISQRLFAKAVARWLPLAGAAGVGAFTYYETGQVAETAVQLFEKPINIEGRRLPAKPGKRSSPARKLAAGKKPKPGPKKPPRKKPE